VPPPPTPTLGPSELTLASSAFSFQDSPEPGARAQLSVTVHNPTDAPGGRISLSLPLSWLSGYRIDTLDPGPVDATESSKLLTLSFNGPDAGSDSTVTVNLTTVDEVIDSPEVTVVDADGRKVGSAHPPTQAPPARPGPIYSIDIPRLHLHSAVVPVDWEPPLFVVGQVRTSAWVSMGNSVLVGHVRGAAGYNVFDHLEQLEPGDEIIANSRGMPYQFVVSDTQVLPEDDTTPTDPTSNPRLTLMTCTGDWDPLARDYPDRLWVIAQPSWMVNQQELAAGHGG
jgi:LPXTG-site transpeptidase (sortase) family protein